MIRFEKVSKTYDGEETPVFSELNLHISQGEFVLLTGPSGCGKSTWIRMLLKDTEPTSGRILVRGQDISRIVASQIPYYRRKLGIVFQDASLIRERTVYENVELARMVAGGTRSDNRRVIASLFQLLGIQELYRRYPYQLSGGERQKVCLARALVNYPSLLLADEPTGNLSAVESEEVMGLFELAHRQGITVVVATHDKASAEGLLYREIRIGR